MKRIISLLLVALLTLSVFCFTGCGAINDSEVSILWSGNGKVEIPNSLINSIERAMYIENIEYKHYGANGDVKKQYDQAKAALENGAQILIVELVSDNALELAASQLVAKQIVDAAKEKNVPVIFFNCIVDEHVINSYDKCVHIASDLTTVADVQGELIADYVKANFKNLDKNADGKISYTFRGLGVISSSAVEKANSLLATEDYVVKTAEKEKINTKIELAEINLIESELIVTESDLLAREVLVDLQKSDYNTDKLTTHFIPVVTVGETVDYKDYVVAGRPELPANLVINEGDDDKTISNKDKEIKKLDSLKKYYEANKYLVDLTAVNESDLDEMIYTTINVVDAGRLAGTATEDRDAIAIAVATVASNFIKGNSTFEGVASEVKDGQTPAVIVEGSFVKIRYIAYAK